MLFVLFEPWSCHALLYAVYAGVQLQLIWLLISISFTYVRAGKLKLGKIFSGGRKDRGMILPGDVASQVNALHGFEVC